MTSEQEQKRAEQLVASRTNGTIESLAESVAFRAAHWSRNLIVRPGMRVATPVGLEIEVVCRLPCHVNWKLRRPANSKAELQGLGRFTPDAPGLFVVTMSFSGLSRDLECVAFPDSIISQVNDGGGQADRTLVLQALVNDGACTRATLVRALENDFPTLAGIHGAAGVPSLKFYGGY